MVRRGGHEERRRGKVALPPLRVRRSGFARAEMGAGQVVVAAAARVKQSSTVRTGEREGDGEGCGMAGMFGGECYEGGDAFEVRT